MFKRLKERRKKVLLTSGCSFSETISPHIDTWPRHLARRMLDYQHHSHAMSSQGNGLISRSIIHACTQHKDADIIVGIVWSGRDRHDFYINDIEHNHLKKSELRPNNDGWVENPTGFTALKRWIILNHNWSNAYAKAYYGMFHDRIGCRIYTLEHILRTQWFLKQHRIPYFMSTYTSEVLRGVKDNSDCKHLYDLIDFDKWLPVDGIYEWVKDNIGEDGFPSKDDFHPSSFAHKEFTDKVIVPFIEDLKNV